MQQLLLLLMMVWRQRQQPLSVSFEVVVVVVGAAAAASCSRPCCILLTMDGCFVQVLISILTQRCGRYRDAYLPLPLTVSPIINFHSIRCRGHIIYAHVPVVG